MYLATLYGSLDHLQHGITTAYDFTKGGPPEDVQGNKDDLYQKAQFRAKMESGIRFEHSYSPGGGGGRAAATPTPAEAAASLENARTRMKAFMEWAAVQQPQSHCLCVVLGGGGANAVELMKEFHVINQMHYLEAPDNEGQQQAMFGTMLASGLLQTRPLLRPLHPHHRLHPAADREGRGRHVLEPAFERPPRQRRR